MRQWRCLLETRLRNISVKEVLTRVENSAWRLLGSSTATFHDSTVEWSIYGNGGIGAVISVGIPLPILDFLLRLHLSLSMLMGYRPMLLISLGQELNPFNKGVLVHWELMAILFHSFDRFLGWDRVIDTLSHTHITFIPRLYWNLREHLFRRRWILLRLWQVIDDLITSAEGVEFFGCEVLQVLKGKILNFGQRSELPVHTAITNQPGISFDRSRCLRYSANILHGPNNLPLPICYRSDYCSAMVLPVVVYIHTVWN